MQAHGTRMAWLILVLLLLPCGLQTVSADPGAGNEEVVNTICQTWNSTSGICDDYNFADDETASQEWIEGRYNVHMANATTMSVTLEWAVHEIRRDNVLLEDLPLGNGSNSESDGIPADYIRNYLDYPTPQGSVRDVLSDSVTSTVSSLINNGFGTTTDVQTTYVNQMTYEDQNIECTDDKDFDSADEVAGLPNDAYNPPICLRSTLSIIIDPAEIGLASSGFDIERTYQGLLTMGSTVRTDLNLTALPGHLASYEFVPPTYGTLVDVSNSGDLIAATSGGNSYSYGRWTVNHKDADDEQWLNESISITMGRRSTTTEPVNIDLDNDRGVRFEILVDAYDERTTMVQLRLALHYVSGETLSNWGWDFGDERISIPWVTSDGLRLAHHSGLADISEDFASRIPVDELNNIIMEYSPTDVSFDEFEFTMADNSGGLDFQHTPGSTCSEPSSSYWCILGEDAMNGTYPVYLETKSNIFDIEFGTFISALADKYDIDLLGYDPSIITLEDREALLNGVRVGGDFDSPDLNNWIDSDLPKADIHLEIVLPSYIRSMEGDSSRITIEHILGQQDTHSLSFTGQQPYDWRHSICRESGCSEDSVDLICGPMQSTCIGVNIDTIFSDLNINEWSQTVEMSAEGSAEILIHRIGVPDSILEDNDNLEIEAIPSDMIRRIVHLGDQVDGGLLGPLEDSITVPIGDEDIPFELSAIGINRFADDVARIVENNLNEEIQESLQELNSDQEDILIENPGHISISVKVDGLGLDSTSTLSDYRPIRILIEISKVDFKVEYTGDLFGGEESVESTIGLWQKSILASNGMSGVEVPPGEDIVADDIAAIFIETEDGIISPSVRLRITLPWGIRFSQFESDMGRGELSDSDGSQTLTYYAPICTANTHEECDEVSDTVSFRMLVGVDYILSQLMGYLSVIFGLFALLFIWRRSRKKRKRERKKAREESERVGQRVSDLNFDLPSPILNEESYVDGSLSEMSEFGGLDKKGNIAGESWDDFY